MKTLLLPLLSCALLWSVAPGAQAKDTLEAVDSTWVLRIQGLTCGGCAKKVTMALEEVDAVKSVYASFGEQATCVSVAGDDSGALVAALGKTSFEVISVERVPECPQSLTEPPPDPWEEHGQGLDVATISMGEEVDLEAHLAADKFTIIDFGASWCGPCHEAAEVLAAYLREHDDVAVRVVFLAGRTAEASYAQPAVKQHMEYVGSLPWFVVYAPGGKVLKRTAEVDKAVSSIDRHRSKVAHR
jgi:copper chaperone CopZ